MSRRPSSPLQIPHDRRRFLAGSCAIAAVLPALGRQSFAQAPQVNVYNWDTYIGETTIEDFSDATGIAVRYDLYASNDELFAKLRGGNPGYDVIFPTNDYVERMIAADMLLPLDHAKIPNRVNVDPAFADPAFDPGLRHTMPYFWGTVGLGYRRSAASPKAFADIFESDAYAGRIALLNSIDSILAALKYLGHSLNTEDPAAVDQAVETLDPQQVQDQDVRPRHRAGPADLGRGRRLPGVQRRRPAGDGGGRRSGLRGAGGGQPAVGGQHVHPARRAEPGERPQLHQLHPRRRGPRRDRELRPLPLPERRRARFHPARRTATTRGSTRRARVLERCEVRVYKGEEIESLYAEALTRVLAA